MSHPSDRRVRRFVAALELEGLAPSTVETYCSLAVRWVDALEAAGVDPCAPAGVHASSWAMELEGGRSTLLQARSVVKRWCEVFGTEDVSGAIKVPAERRKRDRALSEEDARQLAATARQSGRRGLAVLVGLYTAARRSEIASLAWPRVDWSAGWLTLERDKTDDLLEVPMHPELRELLLERRPAVWTWSSGGSPWVFPGRNGGHVSPRTVGRWVSEIGQEAGVAVSTHDLRHTSLTDVNDATGDLRAAQSLAGHSSPAVTARYTRSTAETLERAVRQLRY